jgi:6-phosphogluconolactonase
MEPRSTDVYVGSYTQKHAYLPEACGAGLLVCSFDPQTGKLEVRQTVGALLNPSYLTLDQTGECVVATAENYDAEGAVCVFRRQPDGKLMAKGTQPSGGLATCHVCALPDHKICASSYLDGVLAVYPLRNGIIGARESLFRYRGKSVNATRQENSHAHQAVVSPDQRWLYVCDLGADRIWCHPLVAGRVAPSLQDSVATPAGCGPRHLVFHPTLPRVYVLCELNANLLSYDWDAGCGSLTLADEQPSLPGDWKGEPSAAAIRVHSSGSALYVSNRNHDSLTAFSLDGNGRASLACCISAGGKTPRDFAIDPSGRWLLAANQKSNNVAIHAIDPETGLPMGGSADVVDVWTPVCILFAESRYR